MCEIKTDIICRICNARNEVLRLHNYRLTPDMEVGINPCHCDEMLSDYNISNGRVVAEIKGFRVFGMLVNFSRHVSPYEIRITLK
jgi:hypothetical protein